MEFRLIGILSEREAVNSKLEKFVYYTMLR